MRFLLVFCMLCSAFSLKAGPDYIQYSKLIQRIDRDLYDSAFSTALKRADSLASRYDFIFARDCMKSLQLAAKAGDSVRSALWLERAFVRGVPIWVIRNNELTKSIYQYAACRSIMANYPQYRARYKNGINAKIAHTIDSLLEKDQSLTKKVNEGFILLRHTYFGLKWKTNNAKQFKIIKKITEEHGFPGERLIGLPSWIEDSVQGKGFMLKYGPDFADRRAFTMLIHYFSSRREGINELLHQSVQSGHLPPSQFASFNDFMAEWGKRKYSNQFYNVWHSDPNKDHIEDINERRADIGLGSYQFQIQVFIRKRELQRRQALNSVVIFW